MTSTVPPDGVSLHRYPGTSCQATISLSLRDNPGTSCQATISLSLRDNPGTSCQATISLSLRDKSHSPIEAPHNYLSAYSIVPWLRGTGLIAPRLRGLIAPCFFL